MKNKLFGSWGKHPCNDTCHYARKSNYGARVNLAHGYYLLLLQIQILIYMVDINNIPVFHFACFRREEHADDADTGEYF